MVGSSRFAELLTRRLQGHGQETVLLCTDLHTEASEEIPATEANRIRAHGLRKAGAKRARCVVVMEDADEDNLQICRMIRHLLEVPNVISWVKTRPGTRNSRSSALG